MNILKNTQTRINKLFNYNEEKSLKEPAFIFLSLLSLLAIFIVYSNHFFIIFQFDDAHTIVSNNAIKEIDILTFFKEGSTFSSLPSNQSYRPYITLENAIDYKIGEGNTYVFHIHIFLTFLAACTLLFIFLKQLLNKFKKSKNNKFW